MSNLPFKYSGSELEVFSEAVNWKNYWSNQVRPYIGRRVLEVGAGIGGTTKILCDSSKDLWLALEPDLDLVTILQEQIQTGRLPRCCQVQQGKLSDLSDEELFDTILYIDVLEHIENDWEEVCHAAKLLAPGGYLVVVAPAHQWLYTVFDQVIGHYRRYNRRSLLRLTPVELSCIVTKYLDSVGLLASLGNRLILKSAQPTRNQIRFWDNYMVRLSKWLDFLVFYRLGKSIVAIWQR